MYGEQSLASAGTTLVIIRNALNGMLIIPLSETHRVPAKVSQPAAATQAGGSVAGAVAAPSAAVQSVAKALLTDTQGRPLNHHVTISPAYLERLESMDTAQVAHSAEVYKTAIMKRKEAQSRLVQFFCEVCGPVDDLLTTLSNRT